MVLPAGPLAAVPVEQAEPLQELPKLAPTELARRAAAELPEERRWLRELMAPEALAVSAESPQPPLDAKPQHFRESQIWGPEVQLRA